MYRPPVWLRIAIVALVAAGTIAAALVESVGDAASIHAILDDFGPFMPVVFVVVHVVTSLVFIPRSMMAVVAGMLWGFWPASLLSLVGATAGATAGFVVARYLNAGYFVPEDMRRIGPLLRRAEAGGWRTVMVIRLLPFVPHTLTNYALGLARLRLVDYVIGSFFGLLPITFMFVNLGITGRHVVEGNGWIEPLLWGLALLGLTLLLPRLLRRAP